MRSEADIEGAARLRFTTEPIATVCALRHKRCEVVLSFSRADSEPVDDDDTP